MILRPAVPDDLPYVLSVETPYKEMGFLGGDDIATHRQRLADPDCWYAIVETETGSAGYAFLTGLSSVNRSVELRRIAIAEPNRGLGRLVLSALMQKAFEEFSVHRLWLTVFPDNLRAYHLYKSIGFVEEGTLRECIKRGDSYRSLIVMSVLETEYRQRSSGNETAIVSAG